MPLKNVQTKSKSTFKKFKYGSYFFMIALKRKVTCSIWNISTLKIVLLLLQLFERIHLLFDYRSWCSTLFTCLFISIYPSTYVRGRIHISLFPYFEKKGLCPFCFDSKRYLQYYSTYVCTYIVHMYQIRHEIDLILYCEKLIPLGWFHRVKMFTE